MGNTSRLLLTAASTVLLALPAAAQNQPQTESQRLQDARRQAEQTQAAAEASRQALPAGADVTFEEVLNDPDNIDLNYRFAVAEVQRGNLRSAAGTLERLLLLAPERSDIRLAYAIVLYRLESYTQAQQEFSQLAALNLSPAAAAQVDGYLRDIEQRGRKTRYYAQASVGVNYDTNRTSGPDGDIIQVFGTPRSVAGTAAEQDNDFALVGSGMVGFTHDLGSPRGDELFGRVVGYIGEQNKLSSFDIQAIYAELGRNWNHSFGTFTGKGHASATRLSHENYLNSFGGEVRFDHKVSEVIRLYEAIDIEKRNYQPIGENATADNNDAMVYGFTFGGRYRADPRFFVDAHVRIAVTNARRQFESHRGPEFAATGTWLLDDGLFAQFGGSYTVDDYKAVNPVVSATTERVDRIARLRGTLGVPLSNMIGIDNTPNWLRQSVVAFGLGYTHSMSSIDNYDYDNVQFSAVLNKRWDF